MISQFYLHCVVFCLHCSSSIPKKTASMQPNPQKYMPQRTRQHIQEPYSTAANAGVLFPRQAGVNDHTVEVVTSLQCKT
ncbi:hypothetical protein DER46DRAFT_157194 [Fusarium sp. MPI-SDFR-AT-0072]|nr:hypothetical protein DER46DRAFT_157194 [Fusarium sp. MPI-SDFR-AT-0072]